MQTWESYISLNNDDTSDFEVLPAPSHFYNPNQPNQVGETLRPLSNEDISEYANRDRFPLPLTTDREGYHGERHFEYWLSGLTDFINLQEIAHAANVTLSSYLDFGCASGRVVRHLAAQLPDVDLYACDINYAHVRWVSQFLGPRVTAFQNTSVPYLSLPDASIDAIGAFSVFTHIESFDTAWLMEMRRILKPGGIAYVTIVSEETFKMLDETWPMYEAVTRHPAFEEDTLLKSFSDDKLVFRWHNDRSYASNVIYTTAYIETVWSSILRVEEIRRRFPRYQDAVIMRKD